ncbi:unnamed protein product, partial [Medioppia subpectinata]
MDHVFVINDDLFWTFHPQDRYNQISSPPNKVKNRFPVEEIGIKSIHTGLAIESVPQTCDSNADKEMCLFNQYMDQTFFLFYVKEKSSGRQIYSMLRGGPQNKMAFDDYIGGYAYELRANQSVARSSWPGVDYPSPPNPSESVLKYIGSLFVKSDNMIVMFAQMVGNQNKCKVFKKYLSKPWDTWDASDSDYMKDNVLVSHALVVGAFRKGNDYYLADNKGSAYKLKKDFFDLEKETCWKMYSISRLTIYGPKCVQYMPIRFVKIRGVQLDPSSRTSPWIRVKGNPHLKACLVDECSTVPQLFSKAIKINPQKYAFGCRVILAEEYEKTIDGRPLHKYKLSDYKWFRSEEIDTKVDNISKGFLHIGIKPKDIVMILAETRLEWLLSCQALMRIGSIVATLYATLSPDAFVHGINETQVTHLVTNYDLLCKLAPILDKLSAVKSIVYMDGPKEPDLKSMFTEEQRQRVSFHPLSQIEEIGKKQKHLKGGEPNAEDTAVIMYTSGSTGVPKGVNISHKNLLTVIKGLRFFAEDFNSDEIYCSYLPLAHIFELTVHLFFISNGVTVGFGSIHTLTDKSNGLKSGTKGDLTLLKPTILTAVPLVLDRIRIAIEGVVNRNPFTKLLFNFFYRQKDFWSKRGSDTPLISSVFCKQFKPTLGGKVKFIAIGGAPLSPHTELFIRNCFDVRTVKGYGLTETCAASTVSDLDDLSVGFVGAPLDCVQIKLVDWVEGNYRVTDTPNPRGELIIGGPTVAKGYFKNDKLTEECFKEENGVKWFFTGDIGEIGPNGNIKIIDRKKDIIKLSKGEYISLAKVEEVLRMCPFVDNLCVYGHPLHDYLIALITPNRKELDELAKSLSKSNMTFDQLCDDNDIIAKVLDVVRREGKQSKLTNSEIPNKIKLCAEEWTPDSGLVTTAFKIKRNKVQKHYQNSINMLYGIKDNDS